jgi:hypothetical protein
MRKEFTEAIVTFIGLLAVISAVGLIICAMKYRTLEDNYRKLAVKCKRLETRQVRVYSNIPVNVEPSEDEIIIEVGNAFDRGREDD